MSRYKGRINGTNTFGVNKLTKGKTLAKSADCTYRAPELSVPFLDQDYLPVPSFGPVYTLHNNLVQMQAEATK